MDLEKSHVVKEEEIISENIGEIEENMKKQKKSGSGKRGGWGGGNGVCCQAEKCTVNMTDSKRYYRRHKVCDFHAKELCVMVSGLRQRFCQQCSRFHELSEFDDIKRSCRRRLAGHNERRRRAALEQQLAEGGSSNRANPELSVGPQTM